MDTKSELNEYTRKIQQRGPAHQGRTETTQRHETRLHEQFAFYTNPQIESKTLIKETKPIKNLGELVWIANTGSDKPSAVFNVGITLDTPSDSPYTTPILYVIRPSGIIEASLGSNSQLGSRRKTVFEDFLVVPSAGNDGRVINLFRGSHRPPQKLNVTLSDLKALNGRLS